MATNCKCGHDIDLHGRNSQKCHARNAHCDCECRYFTLQWKMNELFKSFILYCQFIEGIKLNEIIDKVNKLDSAREADPLHSELRILDCCNELKKFERIILSFIEVKAYYRVIWFHGIAYISVICYYI